MTQNSDFTALGAFPARWAIDYLKSRMTDGCDVDPLVAVGVYEVLILRHSSLSASDRAALALGAIRCTILGSDRAMAIISEMTCERASFNGLRELLHRLWSLYRVSARVTRPNVIFNLLPECDPRLLAMIIPPANHRSDTALYLAAYWIQSGNSYGGLASAA